MYDDSRRATGKGVQHRASVAQAQEEVPVLRHALPREELRQQEQILPLGLESQHFNASLCEELLHETCEWSANPRAFLATALSDARGATFQDLRDLAARQHLEAQSEMNTFPLVAFQDFMSKAFRFGLIDHFYESPTGNPYSRERVVYHVLSPRGREIIGGPSELVPPPKLTLRSTVPQETVEILRFLNVKGATIREDMLEALSEKVAFSDLDEFYSKKEATINTCIALGLVDVSEDPLGARVLSLSVAGEQELEKALTPSALR